MYRLHGEIAFDTTAHRNTARTALINRWGTDNTLNQTYVRTGAIVDSYKRPVLDFGGHFETVGTGVTLRQWVLDEIAEHPQVKDWIVAAWVHMHRSDHTDRADADVWEYRVKGPFGE